MLERCHVVPDMETPVSSHPIPDEASPGPRKQMRKGTRSCTECRRRKVRCIFPRGDFVCTRCAARGSRCVEQTGEVNHVDVGETTPRQRSLVTPVTSSRSEVSSPLGSFGHRKIQRENGVRMSEDFSSDIEMETDRRPPLVSFLSNGEDGSFITTAASSIGGSGVVQTATHKANVCEALRSALPRYDDVVATLKINDGWWDSFRQKTRAISQAEAVEPLVSFAARAYTSTSPAEVAILAVAYARALGRSHRLFAVVDNLIISDFALAATLDGMECLILLAKTYTDIGQPRRAWFTWRKGLSIAQLMGLHRVTPTTAARRQCVWWTIYHGDRFTSLLLGLPHGFSDTHFDTSISCALTSGPLNVWLPQFIHQCAVMAGQVIDHISSPTKPSFATSMALDEQMEIISATAPEGWWEIPTEFPSSPTEVTRLVDRLLVSFFFYHVRMYIHLPFLKTSLPPTSYNVSKAACTNAARQMVKLYLVLRATVNGHSLFDCKTSDFVGFTAAVVLLVGLSGTTERSSVPRSVDRQLLVDVDRVFRSLEEDTNCKVAAQCRKVLMQLFDPAQGISHQEVSIPYFGNIVRGRRPESPHPADDSYTANTSFQPMMSNMTTASTIDAQSSWDSTRNTNFMDYNTYDLTINDFCAHMENFEDHAFFPQGLDVASLDIDQDWTLFASR